VLQTWNSTYGRIAWTQQSPAQLALAGSCVLVFLGFAAGIGAQLATAGATGSAAGLCAIFVAVANVAFVVWLAVSLRRLGATTPLSATRRGVPVARRRLRR
jgi:hypothetical protein